MKNMTLVLVLLWVGTSNNATAAETSATMYSESGYMSHSDLVFTASRLRAVYSLWPEVDLNLGAGNDLQKYRDKDEYEPYSYNYLAPGVSLKLGLFTLTPEVRYRTYTDPDYEESIRESRVTGSLGYFDTNSIGPRLLGLSEIYIETVYSRLKQDLYISSGFARLGVRRSVESVYWDVFLEPFIQLDSAHYDYNNKGEVRASSRLGLQSKSFNASLMLSRVYGQTIARGSMETTGEKKPYYYNRAMFVLGGSL